MKSLFHFEVINSKEKLELLKGFIRKHIKFF